jgi:hypothetical protein
MSSTPIQIQDKEQHIVIDGVEYVLVPLAARNGRPSKIDDATIYKRLHNTSAKALAEEYNVSVRTIYRASARYKKAMLTNSN